MFEGPEKKFQKHIADFLIREHSYALLTQAEITDTEFYFAEDHLYAFLKATQSETLERLEVDYGSDARDEIFKALREEIGRRPLWSIIRTGLTVREHDLNQLFVAFTATPSPATVQLFGEPFDTYSEAEAIQEEYIVDVAQSIIYGGILAVGLFTQAEACPVVELITANNDPALQTCANDRELYEQLVDPKYTDKGAFFDIMAYTVIQKGLEFAEAC